MVVLQTASTRYKSTVVVAEVAAFWTAIASKPKHKVGSHSRKDLVVLFIAMWLFCFCNHWSKMLRMAIISTGFEPCFFLSHHQCMRLMFSSVSGGQLDSLNEADKTWGMSKDSFLKEQCCYLMSIWICGLLNQPFIKTAPEQRKHSLERFSADNHKKKCNCKKNVEKEIGWAVFCTDGQVRAGEVNTCYFRLQPYQVHSGYVYPFYSFFYTLLPNLLLEYLERERETFIHFL